MGLRRRQHRPDRKDPVGAEDGSSSSLFKEAPMASHITPKSVIETIEADRRAGLLSEKVTNSYPVYQAVKGQPGIVERIYENGHKEVGTFKDGAFIKQ